MEFSEYLTQNQILSMCFFLPTERKFKKPFLHAWIVPSILPWFHQHFPRQLLNDQCFPKQDHSLRAFKNSQRLSSCQVFRSCSRNSRVLSFQNVEISFHEMERIKCGSQFLQGDVLGPSICLMCRNKICQSHGQFQN